MLLCSFAIITSSPAVLADGWSGSSGYQSAPSSRHSEPYPQSQTYHQSRERDGNPWALPELASPEYDHFPAEPHTHGSAEQGAGEDQAQAGADSEQQDGNWSSSYDHFVTPETLESLKHQQTRMQQTYDPGPYYRYDGYRGGRSMRAPMSYSPYGGPLYPVPYGMGGYNPLFDSPMSSPWLTDPGAMFRGQSFSYVPDEAIGGISPMRTPVYGPGRMPRGLSGGMMSDSVQDSAGDMIDNMPDKVFNPFTFLPDSNLNN